MAWSCLQGRIPRRLTCSRTASASCHLCSTATMAPSWPMDRQAAARHTPSSWDIACWQLNCITSRRIHAQRLLAGLAIKLVLKCSAPCPAFCCCILRRCLALAAHTLSHRAAATAPACRDCAILIPAGPAMSSPGSCLTMCHPAALCCAVLCCTVLACRAASAALSCSRYLLCTFMEPALV